MKKLLALFSLLVSLPGIAQPYRIDWHAISGGGGTSSNGSHTVSGIIGQPAEGGRLCGTTYSVLGGFWSFIAAVETTGAPPLTIRLMGPGVIAISWPSPAAGFVLEQNDDLSTTNWTNVDMTPGDDGVQKTVIASPLSGNQFYRLFKP